VDGEYVGGLVVGVLDLDDGGYTLTGSAGFLKDSFSEGNEER
jgi:hypothetical protein